MKYAVLYTWGSKKISFNLCVSLRMYYHQLRINNYIPLNWKILEFYFISSSSSSEILFRGIILNFKDCINHLKFIRLFSSKWKKQINGILFLFRFQFILQSILFCYFGLNPHRWNDMLVNRIDVWILLSFIQYMSGYFDIAKYWPCPWRMYSIDQSLVNLY